jgi:hypothetical protein
MNKTVYKLSKYVLKRFEENANEEGGLEILYNTQTDKYWTGNASCRFLIDLIDGKNNLKEIYEKLANTVFINFSKDEIIESFSIVIEELEKLELIEKVEK